IVRDDLRPRPRGQSNHQNLAWQGMKTAQRIDPEQPIYVVHRIYIEPSVVDASAKDLALLADGDNAAAVFDQMAKAIVRMIAALEKQLLIEIVEERVCEYQNDDTNRSATPKCRVHLAPGRPSRYEQADSQRYADQNEEH